MNKTEITALTKIIAAAVDIEIGKPFWQFSSGTSKLSRVVKELMNIIPGVLNKLVYSRIFNS